METKIFELIINTGGLALVIAILFYYNLQSFKQHSKERIKLRDKLTKLQDDFHEFKDSMIERLLESQQNVSEALNHVSKIVGNTIK